MSSRIEALAAAALGCFGFWALVSGTTLGSGFTGSFTPRFGVDGLTAFFLGMLGLVAAPTLAYASRYFDGTRRGRANSVLTGAFVLVLAEVLCARDPISFLAGWELMTLLPAAIILVSRSDDEARRTVFLYLAITHLAGAFTWVAVLLAADSGAFRSSGAVAQGSGLQIAIALAALVGMGTKAGLMPMHSWLPLAHPIAPAPASALMSGVMIKVAIYGLVRVLVDWLGPLPIWFGVLVLALGALSAVGGVTYALFQHDLKRLLAFHSIENVGIIVLGIGACLLLRARGADTWAAIALAAALLHTLNHAVFKALLFLGAGSFERAAGSLALDRLGGLLRRLPWTGGAFLVGALAIAGLPPLNGFASEWVTLQALLHVPAGGHLGDGLAGALALGALAATAALAVLCFVKVAGLVLVGRPRSAAVASATERPLPMRAAVGVLAVGVCLPRSRARAALRLARFPRALAGSHPDERRPPPAEHRFAAHTRNRDDPRGAHRPPRALARPPGSSARAQLGLRPTGRARARLDKRRVHQAAAARARRRAATRAEIAYARRAERFRRSPTAVGSRSCSTSGSWRRSCDPHSSWLRHARRLQTGRLGTYLAYLIALILVLLDGRQSRPDRMSALALVVQLAGWILLAPLLPGLIQHWKARLQGRRGPTPFQPYRELRRLWRKSSVEVEGSGIVYRLAPSVTAASLALAVLVVPVAAGEPSLGVGRDILALLAVFALGRFAVAAAAWDVANGFALMGASRDLMIAIFTDVTFVLAPAVAALVAHTTNLSSMIDGHRGHVGLVEPRARPRRRRHSRLWSSRRPVANRSTTPTPTSN